MFFKKTGLLASFRMVRLCPYCFFFLFVLTDVNPKEELSYGTTNV